MRSAFESSGPPIELALEVDGVARSATVPPLRRLLDVLREDLALTATKEGCGEGECGACTVLVDGEAALACLVPACQAQGARVTTGAGDGFDALRASFLATGGAQCGICTPGMLVAARALLERAAREGTALDDAAVRDGLAGNLCRCTGYQKIVDAVLLAARGAR